MRVMLFTDTLGDVNGVSRFIQNVAQRARESGRDLTVVTSTQFACPDESNIVNLAPLRAWRIPKYEHLEIVLPPARRVLTLASAARPEAVHISTPGPVGMLGRLVAKRLRVPALGVYHTDFPAYVDHLFDDNGLTCLTRRFMRWFYGPFAAVFTRSREYASSVEKLGVRAERIEALRPGIDVERFHVRHADAGVWGRVGVPAASVKVLYVGRVSVEKNTPLLSRLWRAVRRMCHEKRLEASLVVVGDGPHRPQLERELGGSGAYFLGFRHGDELSKLYASSDLFVFPSLTDTLGQVVMEAQASGLPVVVSDQGGPKEVVDGGRTGFVLRAENLREWAEAVLGLIADTERRRAMGAAAHRFMQGYSIRASFEHFWRVHARAAGAREGNEKTPVEAGVS